MKNGEKFREEIIRSAKTSSSYDECEFKRTHVLPHFGGDGESCTGYRCGWCYILWALWLDEEYIEPPKPEVDWSKVPVDTLVRVRDNEDEEWLLRYFKDFSMAPSAYPHEYDYEVWALGKTSVTAEGDTERWKYCELVEDEDDGK